MELSAKLGGQLAICRESWVVMYAHDPEGRYSHCMVYQYADAVLYNSYDVLSDNETFGDNSLFIHGGLYEGSIFCQ